MEHELFQKYSLKLIFLGKKILRDSDNSLHCEGTLSNILRKSMIFSWFILNSKMHIINMPSEVGQTVCFEWTLVADMHFDIFVF